MSFFDVLAPSGIELTVEEAMSPEVVNLVRERLWSFQLEYAMAPRFIVLRSEKAIAALWMNDEVRGLLRWTKTEITLEVIAAALGVRSIVVTRGELT